MPALTGLSLLSGCAAVDPPSVDVASWEDVADAAAPEPAGDVAAPAHDFGPPASPCAAIEATYKDLADIHKYVIARSCSLGANTCHHDEDPPPMHTVGLFWNLISAPCNQGVADYDEWDPFCRPVGEGGAAGVLVAPGDADHSYLMIRLLADARTSRVQMPYGAQPLSDEELYAIRAWINSLVPLVSTPSDPIDYSKTPCPL